MDTATEGFVLEARISSWTFQFSFNDLGTVLISLPIYLSLACLSVSLSVCLMFECTIHHDARLNDNRLILSAVPLFS